ncbi:DUF4157 domain-containing protein [Deinococcus sp. Arct2-2]|uniref:eCIS core domain-containing protein n=1 Tax=Deinococcus sp. Arct2-2 TaxID=2568653 RepID=UPI0010A2B968|nr:DUF4157 domain-containing protein [Deinococcus sp. Arct2-2]THF67910.1 DUF4157 domain-containing protein [Deinococcus sp. Arct2-2]
MTERLSPLQRKAAATGLEPLQPLSSPVAVAKPQWAAPAVSPAAALQSHTTRPVQLQRAVVAPVWHASGLIHQENVRLKQAQTTVQRSLAAVEQLSPLEIKAALQRQAERLAPLQVPSRPQTPREWVTVMRAHAQQWEGQSRSVGLNPDQQAQHTGVQQLTAQRLSKSFRQDRQVPEARYSEYATHLVALQRHPLSAPVVRGVLGLIPLGERPALQRAVDTALQREREQEVQDAAALTLTQLQRQAAALEAEAAQPLWQRIGAKRGGGQPLPEAVRRHLEQGLNHDLSAVRIHEDAEADNLAKSVQAVAFTTGTDIFFRSGQFNPNTRSGLELLAHEVTHTVQQSKGHVGKGIDPDAVLETEAQRVGTQLANMPVLPQIARMGQPAPTTGNISRVSGALQRASTTAGLNSAITSAVPKASGSGWLQQLGQAAWKAAYELPVYNAGIAVGVVKGFFGDLWDNLQALGSAASMVYGLVRDVFTGQITSRIGEMSAWAKGLSWEALKQMAVALGGSLKAKILAEAKAWVQPDPFKRGETQGKVLGLILAEVAIAYLTAGTVTAVKNGLVASGKLGQVIAKIPGATQLVAGVQKKRAAFKAVVATAKTATTQVVKSLIPKALLEKLGARGAAQAEKALGSADARAALKQAGEKAKQLPLAIGEALVIIGVNDAANLPVKVLLRQLALLKRQFKWIHSFKATPVAPKKYNITLIASSIPLYENYSAGDGAELIDESAFDHIFKGEVSTNSKGERVADGWHLESAGDPATNQVRKYKGAPDQHGVYVADIKLKDPLTGEWLDKKSSATFFPKGESWTPARVLEEIKSAFANIETRTPDTMFEGRLSFQWEGRSKSGILIRGYYDVEAKKLITAFPLKGK